MAVEVQSKYIDYREGGYYAAGTRIGLDVIVYEFRNGQLPEDILRSYPSMRSLAPRHFADFVGSRSYPGLILIPTAISIGTTIEELYFTWLLWSVEEMANQIRWLEDIGWVE